jgi:nicotinamidase-related amidase
MDLAEVPRMPESTRDKTALIVVDMLSPYDYEDADAVAGHADGPVRAIAQLLESAQRGDVPIVYVNDNHGDWNSSAEELTREALAGRHPDLVEPIVPPDEASFVIKARHSIFYGTPLEYLLAQMGVSRLIVTGQVTEQCILYSALDAYVRHLQVVVPRDAVVPLHTHLADAALEMMERNMRADVPATAELADRLVAAS